MLLGTLAVYLEWARFVFLDRFQVFLVLGFIFILQIFIIVSDPVLRFHQFFRLLLYAQLWIWYPVHVASCARFWFPAIISNAQDHPDTYHSFMICVSHYILHLSLLQLEKCFLKLYFISLFPNLLYFHNFTKMPSLPEPHYPPFRAETISIPSPLYSRFLYALQRLLPVHYQLLYLFPRYRSRSPSIRLEFSVLNKNPRPCMKGSPVISRLHRFESAIDPQTTFYGQTTSLM